MSIDRTSRQPLFGQIYSILLTEMESGIFSETSKLPSEKELCERFGVERNTVRKALQMLVDEGRVARQRGFGTKILSNASREQSAGQLGSALPIHKSVMLIAQEDHYQSGDGESFHFKLIHSFEKRLSEIGYNLMFKSVGKNGTVAEAIRSAAPAAVIFDSYNQSAYHREAMQLGVPCVSVNHYTPLMTSIVSNNFDSAYQVAKRLTDAGHIRIAFILGKRSHQTCIERLSGIQSLYMVRSLQLHEKYLLPGNWLFSSGVEAGDQIAAMAEAERPTAVFAFNDDMAYGCYSSLTRHGLTVPGDVSLVGFDKSDRYDAMFPPLATVDVNLGAIVDYACWVLEDSFSSKAPKACAKIQIDTELCDCGTIRNITHAKETTLCSFTSEMPPTINIGTDSLKS